MPHLCLFLEGRHVQGLLLERHIPALFPLLQVFWNVQVRHKRQRGVITYLFGARMVAKSADKGAELYLQ